MAGKPNIIEDPVEIPGWGQIHGNMIEDAATWAEFHLDQGTDPVWVWENFRAELERLVAQKTWRTPAAGDVLLRLQRLLLAEHSQSMGTHQETSPQMVN